jgi:hypothetical protein
MAVTIVVVTKNVCMSRHWKAGIQAYRIHDQTLARFMLLDAHEPDHSPICPICAENVQHLSLTSKARSY